MISAVVLSVALVSGAAPSEAVLLGVTTPDGALSTYLVDAKGATRLGRGLAVPRKSGFWVVDVSDGPLEEAWVRPAKDGQPRWWSATAKQAEGAGTANEPPMRTPQKEPDVLPRDAGAGTAAAPPRSADAGAAGCEVTNHIQVRFASPELLTLSQHGGTDCNNGGPGSDQATLVTAYRFDETAKVTGDFLVKPATLDSLGKGARDALANAAGEEQQKDACLGEPAESEWLIVRGDGTWGLLGHVGARDATCRGSESSFDVDYELPDSVVGDGQPVNREKLLAEDKDFVDAVASPSGKMVVVLENKRIVVRIGGKQVAASPLPESQANLGIVMEQWASGQKTIDRWRAEAGKALR